MKYKLRWIPFVLGLLFFIGILFSKDINQKNEIMNVGTYFLDMDESLDSEKVKVILTFDTSVTDQINKEAIDGKDIYTTDSVDSLTDRQLLEKAEIYAWNLDTGEEVAIVEIVRSQKENHGEVSFLTSKKTEKTINVIYGLEEDELRLSQEGRVINHLEFKMELLLFPILAVSFVFFISMLSLWMLKRVIYKKINEK